jgi:hypothetical protein
MDKTTQAAPNQSLLDMIVTEYGTLEAGMAVAASNGIDISNIPITGSTRIMPIVPAGAVDMAGTGYLRRNNIVIGTLALPVLGCEIVLKPSMYIEGNVVGAPHSLGYYSFDFKAKPEFIHVNPLGSSYIGDNELYYETEERYILGHPPQSDLPDAITPMGDLSIPYVLPWTVGLGYMLVWSNLADAVKTATFRDIEGNTAYAAPLTVLDNSSQTAIEGFLPDLSIDVISTSAAAITLRLTRFHPTIGLINFRDPTLDWLEAATGGVADPDDPGNENKKIFVLGQGNYTFGVKANYFFPYTTPPHPYPSSAFTMVIRIS